MSTRLRASALNASLLVAIVMIVACGRDRFSPVTPPPPPGPAPTVTSISPSTGSTGGDASVKIVGTGFNRGSTVAFDGIRATPRFDTRDPSFTTMYLETPAHAAGPVDIVVTNLDGGTIRVAAAYTYVSPESFDVNGVWSASSVDGSDRGLAFTIANGKLVSADCYSVDGQRVPVSFTSLPSIVNGEFLATGEDGPLMSGRIVSAVEMVGTINFSPCTGMVWRSYPRTQDVRGATR